MEYIGKYKKMAEEFRKDGCDEYTVEKFIRQEMEADEFRKGKNTTDIANLSNEFPGFESLQHTHN